MSKYKAEKCADDEENEPVASDSSTPSNQAEVLLRTQTNTCIRTPAVVHYSMHTLTGFWVSGVLHRGGVSALQRVCTQSIPHRKEKRASHDRVSRTQKRHPHPQHQFIAPLCLPTSTTKNLDNTCPTFNTLPAIVRTLQLKVLDRVVAYRLLT